MNEPDEITTDSGTDAKPLTETDALRRATTSRTRETQGKRDSFDLERAFHWAHFQDPRT